MRSFTGDQLNSMFGDRLYLIASVVLIVLRERNQAQKTWYFYQ